MQWHVGIFAIAYMLDLATAQLDPVIVFLITLGMHIHTHAHACLLTARDVAQISVRPPIDDRHWQDAIVLSHNHTIYDLPAGTVIEMFSDEYCTGDATVIAQVWTQKLTCVLYNCC